jgi:replication-associated recombination protein RarA
MQIEIGFPQPLSEKYRPKRIAEFVGLEKPKRIALKLAANPYPSAWLFVGPSGTGKTTLALSIADASRATSHPCKGVHARNRPGGLPEVPLLTKAARQLAASTLPSRVGG